MQVAAVEPDRGHERDRRRVGRARRAKRGCGLTFGRRGILGHADWHEDLRVASVHVRDPQLSGRVARVGEPDEGEMLTVGRCCGLVVARPVGDRSRLLAGHHDEDVAFLRVVQALLHGGRRGGVGRGRRRGPTRGRRRRCRCRRAARVRVVAAARHRAEEHGERPHEQAHASHQVRVGVDGQRNARRNARLRPDGACGASAGARARGPSGSPRWPGAGRARRPRPDRSRCG